MELDGKVAVITGAGSGIGGALAVRFAAEGAAVAVLDIDENAAEAVAAQIGATAWHLDVADEGRTVEVVAEIEDLLGPVDVLCLNAGIATGGGVEASNDAWQRTWEINLMAHVYGVRAVLPSMLARGNGYLLHTASAAGLLTNIGAAPYAVTKHGVVALAEWLSVTYGDQGIRVSCLCPQFVDTPMLDLFDAGGDMRSWVHGIAISPEDVAQSVVDGIRTEQFLILPHPDVATYFARKGEDYDRWIAGMRKLQTQVGYEPPGFAV